MKNSKSPSLGQVQTDHMDAILQFLESQTNFKFQLNDFDLLITQKEDSKMIRLSLVNVERVIDRVDYDGAEFIQVNFESGLKVLITRNLVGFKPVEVAGFDTTKIPKVVTTVDLNSITKAIEDLAESADTIESFTEMEVLKKVYQSILFGAVAVGFEMNEEKAWYINYLMNITPASA